MAFPSTVRDDRFINKLGSGFAFASEVDPDGSDLTSADSIHPIGRIQSGNFNKATTVTDDKDAGGDSVPAGTEVAGSLEYTCMQRDKITIDLPETMLGRYARWIQELTNKVMINAAAEEMIQYLVIGKVTPDGSVKIDFANMYPQHKWTAQKVDVAVTLSLAVTGSFGAQTLTGTIAAGTFHVVIEQEKA